MEQLLCESDRIFSTFLRIPTMEFTKKVHKPLISKGGRSQVLCDPMDELDKLDGEPGWKYQVKTAWKNGWKILFGIIVFLIVLALGSYGSL
ncbi:hypothetical protein [Chromobacterium sp.]|uniref:hypothetical protein n=1 Tax=Chromobacterium sp. TaxID=306190 RepID=UPI0035B1B165